MLDLARYEGRRRLSGAAVTTAGIAALTALYVWLFPSVEASGVDLDEYVEAFPPALREAFGITALGSIEGFLAAELYAFVWVLLLAVYLAYAAAGTVAAEVEDGRMDVTLALPLSRERIVAEKFLALLVPVGAVTVVTPVAVYVGVLAIGRSISVADLLVVHLLGVPYLLWCGAIGLVASVLADRADVAQRAAMGVVFGLFLVESVVTGTDFAWLGAVAPSRHYEPSAILVDGTYDLLGGAVGLGATLALVALAAALFARRDVT